MTVKEIREYRAHLMSRMREGRLRDVKTNTVALPSINTLVRILENPSQQHAGGYSIYLTPNDHDNLVAVTRKLFPVVVLRHLDTRRLSRYDAPFFLTEVLTSSGDIQYMPDNSLVTY